MTITIILSKDYENYKNNNTNNDNNYSINNRFLAKQYLHSLEEDHISCP